MNSLNLNKIQIIQIQHKRYKGELWLRGTLRASAVGVNKPTVIRKLNEEIAHLERMKGITLPRINPDGKTVLFRFEQGISKVIECLDPPQQAVETEPEIAKLTENPPLATTATTETEKAEIEKVEEEEPAPEKAEFKVEKTEKANKPKPKRKLFTPYGLKGYLVDKQGNVRLMLDRKASAQTIVLTAEMFGTLAEMVKKTQEQSNARL